MAPFWVPIIIRHILFRVPPPNTLGPEGKAVNRIKAILAGAVSEWNKENPTKSVQPGDRVGRPSDGTTSWLDI